MSQTERDRVWNIIMDLINISFVCYFTTLAPDSFHFPSHTQTPTIFMLMLKTPTYIYIYIYTLNIISHIYNKYIIKYIFLVITCDRTETHWNIYYFLLKIQHIHIYAHTHIIYIHICICIIYFYLYI